MRLTPWDARCAARACAIACAAIVIAWVVTAASDEGGVTWGERAGRALPFAPVCGALGAWLALAPGRARGEDVALAALGRSPWGRQAGAIAGGAGMALVCAIAIGVIGAVDVRGFFPRADVRLSWRVEGASFVSSDGAWSVAPSGEPSALDAEAALSAASRGRSSPASAPPRFGRAAAALATALAGIALPMLAARARRRNVLRLALAALACAVATALAFQSAAASRVPSLLAAVPPLLLLGTAASLYTAAPWRRARSPR
jgi:hypothetical protein